MGVPNTLVDGNTASATPVNENFVYLDDRITSTSSSLTSQVNSVQSSLSTVNSECVHKTGTETVAGNKTFSGNNTHSGSNNFTGTTTAVTQAVSSNNTRVATTAWVRALLNENITKAANGGVKLPNGLIIEWATFTTSTNTYKKWAFKNSFTSASSYAVVGSCVGTSMFAWNPGINYSSGYCNVYIDDRTCRFIAVGY